MLRESYHFLMEGVPHQIDYLQVGADLAQVAGVLSVHDLHVWDMSPGQPALIGHLEIRDLANGRRCWSGQGDAARTPRHRPRHAAAGDGRRTTDL